MPSRCGASCRSWAIPEASRGRLAGLVLSALLAPALTAGAQVAAAPVTAAPVTSAPVPVAPPWEIPASELASQRLFRLRYGGPEGEVSIRVVLHLADADHYRISAADLVGRPLWSLSVDAGEGLWADHRGQRYCRFTGVVAPPAVPVSPFASSSLPPLLLGRLPAVPAEEPVRTDGNLELVDREGHRWTAHLAGDSLERWTLWDGEEPVAWWSRQGGESILSERRRGMQIRWREVLREPLAGALPTLTAPPSYREDCAPDLADETAAEASPPVLAPAPPPS